VKLLAVSKEQPLASINDLVAAGLRVFAENKVQALAERIATVDRASELRWHMIGPLQSNKAKDIARLRPALVHTIDRVSLINALAARWDAPTPLSVCIQVNMDGETQKAGCRPSELEALVDHVMGTDKLLLKGLMAIPAPDGDASLRRAFGGLRELGGTIADRVEGPVELSMGMSDDFALAIAEGATMIRVGSALFGPRS